MFNELNPGSVIIIIPTKPTITANHLYKPTLSLKKIIDNIVVNIGAAKEMLTTVAKGRLLRAINIEISAINPDAHLKKCKPALFV